MKKKVLSVLLVGIMALSMAGCGDDITLDKQENELVAEYIAGEMLKFSYDNEWKYTKVRTALNKYESNGSAYSAIGTTQQTTTAASTKTTTAASGTTTKTTAAGTTTATTAATTGTTNAASASTDVYKTLADTMGISGNITLKDCTATERYPMEEYAVCISAKDNYKIVAVEFNITNNSSSDITLNTSSSGVTMRLEIGGKTIVQTASMLTNDIISLSNITVEAGGTYTAAACFQVPENIATGEATVDIYKSGSSIGTISGITVTN